MPGVKNASISRIGPETRKLLGCIATLESEGERYSRQFADINEVIRHCDQHGAVVICISTVDTIMRDLQGSRAEVNYKPNATWGAQQPADRMRLPEEAQLSSKGRLDLFAGKDLHV